MAAKAGNRRVAPDFDATADATKESSVGFKSGTDVNRSEGNDMGLYDFIKDKVLGHGGPDPEAIMKKVHDLGLNVQNLGVTVADKTATVTGLAVNRAEASKVVMAVGNNDGIDKVDNQMRVPLSSIQPAAAPDADDHADEDKVTFHKVESGDTLSAIAKKVYGDANKYPVIFEANKPMLSDPNKIYPGQMLRIPAL